MVDGLYIELSYPYFPPLLNAPTQVQPKSSEFQRMLICSPFADQLLLSINEREKSRTSLDILIQASKLFRLKTSNDFFLDIIAPDVYCPHLIILCPTRSHPMCKNVFWKNNLSWKNSFWLQNYYRINFSVTRMTLLI